MNIPADKPPENKSQANAENLQKLPSNEEATFQFKDNRPAAIEQRNLISIIHNSRAVKQFKAWQKMVNNSTTVKQLKAYQAMADNYTAKSLQRKEDTAVMQAKSKPVQKIDTDSAGHPGTAAVAVIQFGNQPSGEQNPHDKKKKEEKEKYEGPSEADKLKAIEKGYNKLLLVAAHLAKQQSARFKLWQIESIITDPDIVEWIEKAITSDEGDEIIRDVAYRCESFDLNDIAQQLKNEPRRRRQAEAHARAGDRRLIPPKNISDNDLANDRQNKEKINAFSERILQQYHQPVMAYNQAIVLEVLKSAKDRLSANYGVQLSMNRKAALDTLEYLVNIAQLKGYPVENKDFVNELVEIAIAVYLIGISGSENADKEQAGGEKANSKR